LLGEIRLNGVIRFEKRVIGRMVTPIQRQGIGVLGHKQIGQQLNTGDTFAQGMDWP
jgi:hypothetical protein